jgi:hypothetical protein
MNQENMACTHNKVLFSLKEEENNVLRYTDGSGELMLSEVSQDQTSQKLRVFPHVWKLDL